MSTQYYGRAEEAANGILDAFKAGNIPAALNIVFINRADNVPCRAWSWSNRFIAALHGFSDARGFRQWEDVDRNVKKGEKAFYILVPCIAKRKKDDGTEESFLYGFKSAPVFGYTQTEGEPLPQEQHDNPFLDALPCIEVARKWGLNVECFNGQGSRHYGYYQHGQKIALGVEHLHTWAHELMHAADHRLGNLTERGQHYRSETVADFGAVVLLEMLGMEKQSDRGFCWKYITGYCEHENKQPISVCMQVLKRVCDAINLILAEAETLNAVPEQSKRAA